MPQAYIRLRGAIFAEDGFAFDAPLFHKSANAYFRKLDADGHPVILDPIPGCDGESGRTICVDLADYPAPDKARPALITMCAHLGDALDGDALARAALADAWASMLLEGLDLKSSDAVRQLGILQNVFGNARVAAELKQHGTIAFLGEPDWGAMLDEALPV